MRSGAALLVLAVLIGSAHAAPKKAPQKHHRTPAPPSTPAPPPTPPSVPGPVAPPTAPAAPAASADPISDPTPDTGRVAPPPTPKLAMRPRAQAHDGFVGDMDCSACHTAEGWQLAQAAGKSGFDHDRTGFPLRGFHTQTQCNGCHTGITKPATNCAGCHHDPHQGRHDETCAECHTAIAWSDTNALEQHRRTRMPLTGRHASVDCSACHKRQGERQFSAVPTDCYSCHRAEYHANTVHPTHDGSTGKTPFPRDCSQCHRTLTWSTAVTDPSALPRLAMAQSGEHDAYFVLSTGSHRAAECSSCHADERRMRFVRCDGCHQDAALRSQHTTPIVRSASGCLHCHPRGAAR